MKEHTDFGFGLEKKPPLWKDFCVFGLTVMGFWGTAHLCLNFSAYAQILSFKAQALRTTVVDVPRIQPESPSKLQLVQSKGVSQRVFRHAKLKPRNHAHTLFSNLEIYPSDNRIFIPRIGKNVPLVSVPHHQHWGQLEKNIQEGLQDGVVVHPTSRKPGSRGNFFATGHSSYYPWDPGRFKDVFSLLHEVRQGDEVQVYWEGQKYVYRMREERVVPPTEVSVLNHPEDRSILTLMTCTPVGTNKNRLILVGDLIHGGSHQFFAKRRSTPKPKESVARKEEDRI